jgi:LytS/YehU family sensor histidine kinase
MNTELELNLLKSQINPHFLFNTLNNIYSLSLQKSDRSPEMILKLSDLMRYMLYECNVPFIDLQREIQFLQDYIDLEKIRHGEKVEILFSVQGAPDGLKIPPLLLIPFVENAFKHGVNAQFGNAWVHISLLLENNHIVFEIKNNKPQTAAQRNLNSSGIGIENAKKRLQLIYPNKHVLEINDLSASFHIKLSIDK